MSGDPSPHLENIDPGWAWIDGEDVCLGCQTSDERQDLARRLADLIEQEMLRRQQAGTPPDRHEQALIPYAMALRDEASDVRAEEPRPRSAPSPDHLDVDTSSAGSARGTEDGYALQVAITGAFLTGHPLQVPVERYAPLQRALRKTLATRDWCLDTADNEEGTYRTTVGGGFSKSIPLVIARRRGPDLVYSLSCSITDAERVGGSLLGDLPALLEAQPTDVSVDVYDLGVAVLTAWFDVTASVDLEAAARALTLFSWIGTSERAASPVARALQKIATTTTEQYGGAVDENAGEFRAVPWLSISNRSSREGTKSDLAAAEQGRLLWLHPVQVLKTDESARERVRQLAPTFHRTMLLDRGAFASGIGSSALAVSPASNSADAPLLLINLHWAYYALYMEIDRGLLGVLAEPRWAEPATLSDLEQEVELMFANFHRVADARARLDSELIGRGGDELAIWNTIEATSKFGSIVEAVERKIDALQKVAQYKLDQANTKRSRRIERTLGVLSMFAVVTLVGSVIGVLFGSKHLSLFSDWQSLEWARAGIIGGAAVVAAILYWWVYHRPGRSTSHSLHTEKSDGSVKRVER